MLLKSQEAMEASFVNMRKINMMSSRFFQYTTKIDGSAI